MLIAEVTVSAPGEGTRAKGRNPGTVLIAEVTVTAPPWFMVRAQKPAGEEVSASLLTTALPLYYMDQGQANTHLLKSKNIKTYIPFGGKYSTPTIGARCKNIVLL